MSKLISFILVDDFEAWAEQVLLAGAFEIDFSKCDITGRYNCERMQLMSEAYDAGHNLGYKVAQEEF